MQLDFNREIGSGYEMHVNNLSRKPVGTGEYYKEGFITQDVWHQPWWIKYPQWKIVIYGIVDYDILLQGFLIYLKHFINKVVCKILWYLFSF